MLNTDQQINRSLGRIDFSLHSPDTIGIDDATASFEFYLGPLLVPGVITVHTGTAGIR